MAFMICESVIAMLGGTAALVAAGAWLTKALISKRLGEDTEKFKALLTRAGRVHERQVDTLTKLYRHFSEAQAYFQRMAATVRFEGEVSADEYRRLHAIAVTSARDALSDGRLLIPSSLAQQCDRFFSSLFEGHAHLAFAQHPMIADGAERAAFWEKAKTTAYKEVPGILQEIEKAARSVIHGEHS
jgi:hypothetical protein